ncbi:MAG: alpha/beta hydrolase family protein [Myxococcales bacterium]|nr:alpha/beta hydrolase family protein [Myxococcales bacterium]
MNRRAANLLDGFMGLASRGLWSFSPPHPNTLDELAVYRDKSQEELFPAPPPQLPEVTIEKRWGLGGLLCEDLCFESVHRPIAPYFRQRHASEYQANHWVYARWMRHVGGRRRPTMIYLHGWTQFEPWLEEMTLMPAIARALDVDVVHMQLPYHGYRKPKKSRFHGEYFWTADLVRTFEAVRQSVLDARSLLGWLVDQGHGPVGYAGVSLGGALALCLACVEPRAAFSIPIVAHLDLPGALEEAPILYRMRKELREYGWGPREVADFFQAVGWYDMTPVISKERILMIAGKYDRFLTPERTTELWKLWGEPPIHWFEGGHTAIVGYIFRSIAVMKRFIDGLDLR